MELEKDKSLINGVYSTFLQTLRTANTILTDSRKKEWVINQLKFDTSVKVQQNIK